MKNRNLIGVIILAVLLSFNFAACNNFFHDLVPSNENDIKSFFIPGQFDVEIGRDYIISKVESDASINSVIPQIRISDGATIIPVTMDYAKAAFPDEDMIEIAIGLQTTNDLLEYVVDLIERTEDFSVPELNIPIDFSGPVTFIVISARGNMKEYTVHVLEDTGDPRLVAMRFSKYNNPYLLEDAACVINESAKTITAVAMYPAELSAGPSINNRLIPNFEILGDKIEVDGAEVISGTGYIQFNPVNLYNYNLNDLQTKTITVHRDGQTVNYTLNMIFRVDQDTIRSITDFRFNSAMNSGIAATAVGSIVNNDNTGTITVQVYYSGSVPSVLKPSFVSPGDVSVNTGSAFQIQTSDFDSHDFSNPIEYRVVSQNGMFQRLYTVNVEFINISANAPRITSFNFSNRLNYALVQDSIGVIEDGLGQILIDVYYNANSVPYILIPEFKADGIVTVAQSVQVSGSSVQDFSSSIKYIVTSPVNENLKREYWIKVRFTLDRSGDAAITAFSFHPDENPGLQDEITARINQTTGAISIFAPLGSGTVSRIMIPRFTAQGIVSVGGFVQTSGSSGLMFDQPVTYTVVSANGRNTRTYTVEVRELQSRIYVNCNAVGANDGTSWQNAFISLQSAILAAAEFPQDDPKEIWIAKGTYKPGLTYADYFKLIPNTSYIGGFAGNETSKSMRNTAANPVIISGELNGGARSQNLFGNFNGTSAVFVNGNITLENLTLTGARAYGTTGRSQGSAIRLSFGSGYTLEIKDCIFNDLAANGYGGAVYLQGGSLEITDCSFNNVNATSYGGAIYLSGSDSRITGTSFTNCISNLSYGGGAVYTVGLGKTSHFTGLTITGGGTLRNPTQTGGAIYNSNTNLKIENSSIANIAGSYAVYSAADITVNGLTMNNISGYGIYAHSTANMTITDVTGSNIFGSSSVYFAASNYRAEIYNCAFTSTRDVYVSAASILIDGLNITSVNNDINRPLHASAVLGNLNISNVVIHDITDNINFNDAIFASAQGDISINGAVIAGVPNGRGIYTYTQNHTVISNSYISNCNAGTNSGAGILLGGNYETSTAVISNTTIENVTAGNGAGIYTNSMLHLTLNDTTITNALATYTSMWGSGGLVFINTSGEGGNPYYGDATGTYRINNDSTLTINNSRFDTCHSHDNNGALFSIANNTIINGTYFLNCYAKNEYKQMSIHGAATVTGSTFEHRGLSRNMFGTPNPNVDYHYQFFVANGNTVEFNGCTFYRLLGNGPASRNNLFGNISGQVPVVGWPYVGNNTLRLRLINCTVNYQSRTSGETNYIAAVFHGDIAGTGGDERRRSTLYVDGLVVTDDYWNGLGSNTRTLFWLSRNGGSSSQFRFGSCRYGNSAQGYKSFYTGIGLYAWWDLYFKLELDSWVSDLNGNRRW